MLQPTVEGFLASARQSLASASPAHAMRALLDATVDALHTRPGRWIEHDDDELLLTSSPELTVYHIALSPRVHYPPHEHRVPAMIGLYQGAETSFSYRRNGTALVQTERHDHAAPCVAALPADVIHSVVNMGDLRSAAIHVYFWRSDRRGAQHLGPRSARGAAVRQPILFRASQTAIKRGRRCWRPFDVL